MLETIIGRKKRANAIKEELIRLNSIKFDFSKNHSKEQAAILSSQRAQLTVTYNLVYTMTKGNLDNLSLLLEEEIDLISKRLSNVTFNYYLDEKYRQMVIFLMNTQAKLSELSVKESNNLDKYKQKIKKLISLTK